MQKCWSPQHADMLITMFGKKKDAGTPGGDAQAPVGFTKRKNFLFFKVKSKPIYAFPELEKKGAEAKEQDNPVKRAGAEKRATPFSKMINNIIKKKKNYEYSLREAGIRQSPYDFVKRMLIYSVLLSIALGAGSAFVLYKFGMPTKFVVVMPVVLLFAGYMVLSQKLVETPLAKMKSEGKKIEKDILYAARDLVISMRSGMPLFNAMTAVSTGYGSASKEFAKVVELIQLGMPIEQAMEEVSQKSKSKTFQRIMLQASVSIRAGIDVTGALQEVVEEVTQERVIELRRYGQKLNAYAMFYMLFGVIFPSMGIAVATIMTTFINIFTVNVEILAMVIFSIVFLQVIFLNLMRASRPAFSM